MDEKDYHYPVVYLESALLISPAFGNIPHYTSELLNNQRARLSVKPRTLFFSLKIYEDFKVK